MTEGRSKAIKALAVLVVVVLIIAVLLLPATQTLLRAIFLGETVQKVPEGISIGIQRTMVVDANGGKVTNASIVLGLPTDVDLMQDVTVSSVPPYMLRAVNGTSYMTWTAGQLINRQTLSVTVNYEFHQTTKVWELASSQVGTTDDIPSSLQERYLHDEWKIIVNNSAIRSLGMTLQPNSENVLDTVQAIYDWTVDNVDYSAQTASGQLKSSLETLNSKVGDCDEQSILFCALARSVGVPAWLQLGMIYDAGEATLGGHGWVQCYIPLKSGGGVNVTIDVVNRDFLVWTPYHILDYTDNGNADDLKAHYSIFSCLYDPSTYNVGELPEFSDEWTVVSYQETEEKVTVGSVFVARVVC